MPPKRNQRTGNGAGEDDLERRDEQRFDRIEAAIAALTEQVAELAAAQARATPYPPRGRQPPLDTPFGREDAEEDSVSDYARTRRRPDGEDRRWENGLRTEIPEFQGQLQPEEFIDWLHTVEEVLDFKGVPEDRRVPLVATRPRGRAMAWWQQQKQSRLRMGKPKVSTWEKMKKHMRANFLPYNYQRLMYQRLQTLRQGSRSVEEYTTEFYQLVARNDIHETEEQLVSRYIGGLRDQIREWVNDFDPLTVSEAHQRAIRLERRPWPTGFGSGTAPRIGDSANPAATAPTSAPAPSSSNIRRAVPNTGLKCFACGEPGHRQAECKRAGKRAMFAENSPGVDEDPTEDVERNSDHDGGGVEEEVVEGDIGPALMMRRSCLAPRAVEEDWLRHNVFQSTCTIKGKICTFIIDSGCCGNIIATEAVNKLGLAVEKHPKPYKLLGLNNRGEVTVSKRVLVPFSVGSRYKDELWCDVVEMDACHLLLGRPWQYDREVNHDGKKNTYSFVYKGVKIVLVPRRETSTAAGHLLDPSPGG